MLCDSKLIVGTGNVLVGLRQMLLPLSPVTRRQDGPQNWWEDAGFYEAVSAGATAAVFFYLTMRSVRSAA